MVEFLAQRGEHQAHTGMLAEHFQTFAVNLIFQHVWPPNFYNLVTLQAALSLAAGSWCFKRGQAASRMRIAAATAASTACEWRLTEEPILSLSVVVSVFASFASVGPTSA